MGNKQRYMQVIGVLCCLFITLGAFAQEKDQVNKKQEKELLESQELLSDASLEMQKDNFSNAEADYRRAIALNPVDETGKYNLGTAYYNKEKNDEAMRRFQQAASVSENKSEKHKAFHNLGNTFMNAKNYQGAVDAYKNALRNNPTDDETRYNLALAKEMLEKDENGGGGDDDKEQDDKDKNEEENKDKNEENKENKEGDDGEEKEDKDKGDQKDENKEGDNENEEGKPEQPKDQEGDKPQQQQPVPGQLSPQQIKNLLEAMNNEEKKVQEKINAKKQKGAKVKSDKDW